MREGQKIKQCFSYSIFLHCIKPPKRYFYFYPISCSSPSLQLQIFTTKFSFCSVLGFPKFDNLQKMWYNIITKMREKTKPFIFHLKERGLALLTMVAGQLFVVVSSALLLCHKDTDASCTIPEHQ